MLRVIGCCNCESTSERSEKQAEISMSWWGQLKRAETRCTELASRTRRAEMSWDDGAELSWAFLRSAPFHMATTPKHSTTFAKLKNQLKRAETRCTEFASRTRRAEMSWDALSLAEILQRVCVPFSAPFNMATTPNKTQHNMKCRWVYTTFCKTKKTAKQSCVLHSVCVCLFCVCLKLGVCVSFCVCCTAFLCACDHVCLYAAHLYTW